MSFTLGDWSVVIGYIVLVAVLGSLFYRKSASSTDYFLSGRTMRAVPVAISLVAADLSAASMLGFPAWGYDHNLELLVGSLSYLLVAPIVIYIFLPFYSRLNLYTAYQYLERRFNLPVRLVGSSLFLFTRGAHVAIVIYAPSIVLSLISGLSVVPCILIIGGVTTCYTALGGMKAVIWTDVLQFTILIVGTLSVCWLSVSRVPGGFSTVLHVASASGRLNLFNFSTNLHYLTSVWAMALGVGTLFLSQLGTDQAYIQRYFATRSLSEARKSILLDGLINIPVSGLLLLLGTVLYVYYHHYPQRLVGLPVKDAILPFFVIHEIPGVISGLIIASLFAASMAVMSAGINSLATVTTVDFYYRLFRKDGQDAKVVRVGRIGTLCWGVAATVGALFAGHLGPLVMAFNFINSFVAGPILGIFLLGMLTVRAKSTATIAGAIIGLLMVSVTAAESRISFFYFSFIGVCVTCISGYLLSLIGPAIDPSRLKGLVWMKRSQDCGNGIQEETKGTEIGSEPNQGKLNASL